jgi:ChrR Cupin-like domain
VNYSSSPEERAASYAFDILEEQEEFERELAESADLQAELASFQAAVGDLAYAVPPVPLPAEIKHKLFDRLDRLDAQPDNLLDLMNWSIADLQKVAMDLSDWKPFPLPEGSERVTWQVDKDRSQVAFFLRIYTPGSLPNHWHATGESILVLEGNFIDDDGTVYGVGDRFDAPANTSHQPSTSMGCLVLGVSSMDDRRLPTLV